MLLPGFFSKGEKKQNSIFCKIIKLSILFKSCGQRTKQAASVMSAKSAIKQNINRKLFAHVVHKTLPLHNWLPLEHLFLVVVYRITWLYLYYCKVYLFFILSYFLFILFFIVFLLCIAATAQCYNLGSIKYVSSILVSWLLFQCAIFTFWLLFWLNGRL